jgi:hypothetical protein
LARKLAPLHDTGSPGSRVSKWLGDDLQIILVHHVPDSLFGDQVHHMSFRFKYAFHGVHTRETFSGAIAKPGDTLRGAAVEALRC